MVAYRFGLEFILDAFDEVIAGFFHFELLNPFLLQQETNDLLGILVITVIGKFLKYLRFKVFFSLGDHEIKAFFDDIYPCITAHLSYPDKSQKSFNMKGNFIFLALLNQEQEGSSLCLLHESLQKDKLQGLYLPGVHFLIQAEAFEEDGGVFCLGDVDGGVLGGTVVLFDDEVRPDLHVLVKDELFVGEEVDGN